MLRVISKRKVFLLLIILAIFLILPLLKKDSQLVFDGSNHFVLRRRYPPPIVLWWTELFPHYHQTKECGFIQCTFTVDRRLIYDDNTRALVFYGSDMNKTDFPLPRRSHHLWALFHEESPKNVPYIQHENVLRHFNITSTFSRYSDFPLTTQYIKNVNDITDRKYLVPIGTKSMLRKKLAPVAYIQSICDTPSGRDEYVKQLMRYIDIDSYGKCLHNKDLPKELVGDYLNTIESDEFYKFFARYKFIIAYENAVCNDYITEKFWRTLLIGSIPIYFGSPTIRDWQPTQKSVIYISDFSSPKLLAEFLQKLDEDDFEYNTFLDHKYSYRDPVTSELLKSSLFDRIFDPDQLFEHFECYICSRLHRENFHSIANGKHYDCGDRLQFPSSVKDSMANSDWHSVTAIGKCQANVLNMLLERNVNFTEQEFDDLLELNIKRGNCHLG